MSRGETHRRLAIAALMCCVMLGAGATSAWAADYDHDGVTPPADCDDYDAFVHPGQADKPDLSFEDTNCDGIDGDAAKAVFVDPVSGLDTSSGARAFPVKTLGRGLTLAAAQGKDVYVRAATYNEALDLRSNVGVYGGYAAGFAVRSASEQTVVNGSPAAAVADGDTRVVLQLLTLNGAPDSALSAYGVRAVNGFLRTPRERVGQRCRGHQRAWAADHARNGRPPGQGRYGRRRWRVLDERVSSGGGQGRGEGRRADRPVSASARPQRR